jgi:polyisoprenoid-binding protein YceI
MRRSIFFAGGICLLMLASFKGSETKTAVYKIDVQKSTIEWTVEKTKGRHNGTLTFSGGEITVKKGIMSGNAEIDMKTIRDLDIEKEENRTKFETHLKSTDFFDTEKFPKATFVIAPGTKLASAPGLTQAIKGSLTIRDKTNEVSFDAQVIIIGNTLTCTGIIPVDHVKFNIAPDNKNIKETFDVKVIIIANK